MSKHQNRMKRLQNVKGRERDLRNQISRLTQENAALRAELGECNPGPLRFMSFEDKLREAGCEIVDVKEEPKA